VPLTGLATVISDARAGREKINPENIARVTRARRFVWLKFEQYLFTNNIILLKGG
jgi:hypothetical protein